MSAAPTASPRRLTRLVPILGWLPSYDRRWLRGDVLAGIAVAAMIVPKDLGYASIAGVPVENGLYAAAAAAIIYGLFCTSRHISTGPSSSLAAVAGGAVLLTGLSGDGRGAARGGDRASRPARSSCSLRSSSSAGWRASSRAQWSPASLPALRSTSSSASCPSSPGHRRTA